MSEDTTLLRIEYIVLEDAVLWDRNPKRHDIGESRSVAEAFAVQRDRAARGRPVL